MNACVLRRISEAELGGDPNADPSDSFAAALLSLAAGDGANTGGKGFSESAVRATHTNNDNTRHSLGASTSVVVADGSIENVVGLCPCYLVVLSVR